MPLKRGKSLSDFDSYIDKRVVAPIIRKIVSVLCEIGAYGYDLAFNHGSYQDQSGCMRSSIGWGVTKDGKLVKSGGFKKVRNGDDGVRIGKKRLKEIASSQKKGISLIIVAGEKYAVYVEAMGYDVLSFSELQCFKIADEMINSILK